MMGHRACVRRLQAAATANAIYADKGALRCLTEEDYDFFTENGKRFPRAYLVERRAREAQSEVARLARACPPRRGLSGGGR
jgi:hypothetical protein